VLAVSLGAGGCSFGPKAIEHTHRRYAAAVVRVDEEQLLRNIVRRRYTEAPINLDVSPIAAQYELSASAEARPFFSTEAARFENPSVYGTFTSILPFLAVGGANRPTVSMTPQDDGPDVRRFLTPISADTLAFLTEAGWPISGVLRIWIDRLNGVPNWVPPAGPMRETPPDFLRFHRACELLQAAQDQELASLHMEDRATEQGGPLRPEAVTASAMVEAAKAGFEYRPRDDGKSWALVKRERRMVLQVNPAGLGSPELSELATLLNLRPGQQRYELAVSSGVPDPAKNPSEPAAVLRLTPRSTAQALFFLANGVEVPPEHLACGLVRVPDGVDAAEATTGLFRVLSCPKGCSHKPPPEAYVAVCYRGHWYYIDDRDQESKATLLLMLQLTQLDFKRQQIGAVPALTLPVGR
jgi:hypothetical protein